MLRRTTLVLFNYYILPFTTILLLTLESNSVNLILTNSNKTYLIMLLLLIRLISKANLIIRIRSG